MAYLLKDLGVDSIPLNFLIPIKGTPMEDYKQIDPINALRVIAVFRIIVEDADIKVVAGRDTILRDYQEEIFEAGANGIMVGGYLTTGGMSPAEDKMLIEEVRALWKKD